jgi:pyridoxal phosphate enzyme (YggS family)
VLSFEQFQGNAREVLAMIAEACAAAGRDPRDVKLLPVTKSHPAQAVEFVARLGGLPAVGENRVQEAIEKQAVVTERIQWELIGHLQSNKAALAAGHFDRVQSVDSVKLIGRLAAASAELGRTLPILLQVNAGRDPAKFGAEVEEAPRLLEAALAERALAVQGLMTIAPLSDDPAVADRTFASLRTVRDDLAGRFGVPLPELSMGMSGDFPAAIAAGSTLVRVGTALFGAR